MEQKAIDNIYHKFNLLNRDELLKRYSKMSDRKIKIDRLSEKKGNDLKSLNHLNDNDLNKKYLVYLKNLFDDSDDDTLLSHVIEYECNKKVSEAEISQLDLVKIKEYGNPKILAHDEDLYVIKRNEMVIKTKPNIIPSNEFLDSLLPFNEIAHEIFLGLEVINGYEGFMYTIGGKLDYHEKIFPDALSSSVVTQYVEGDSMEIWFEKCIGDEDFYRRLYNVILKLLINLYSINKKTEFTHNDLVDRNIIINENEEPIIIDFGTSYAIFNGRKYGQTMLNYDIKLENNWKRDVGGILSIISGRVKDHNKKNVNINRSIPVILNHINKKISSGKLQFGELIRYFQDFESSFS